MDATPYIFFNGQGQDALAFYKSVFGTEPTMLMPMGDGPPDMNIPEERANWIMHCELPIGSSKIYLSDDFMANSPAMEGCSIMVNLATAKEAKGLFDKLAKGGDIRMPFEPTFWSAGFGALTDQFGIRWMVGCDEPPTDG